MSKPLGPDHEGTICLSFSANMRFVRPVRHFISALCALAEYGEDETESIALVTTEMINNSIEHGSNGPEEEIHVTLQVSQGSFICEVVDPGKGGADFASHAVEKAQAMPDLEEPRGRGLFLIRNYMDELEISFDPQRGTRIRVVKVRSP